MIPSRDTPLAEINITPLVDVMLVLLVIFMIAAPALSNTLTMTMPGGDSDRKPATKMTVQVQAGDTYTLDGQSVTARELDGLLRTAVATTPELKLVLDVDPNADYSSAMAAMSTVRGAGIEAIALVEH